MIEVIVVVVVISVLLAILLPALTSVRRHVRERMTLARLSDNARVFTSYANQFKDTWPYLTDPSAPHTRITAEKIEVDVKYFDITASWHLVLADAFFGLPWYSPEFTASSRGGAATDFWYSVSCIAHPDYFRPESRKGPAQWTSTTVGDVSFPSSKTLFLAAAAWLQSSNRPPGIAPMAFVDGSATHLSAELANPGYPGGVGSDKWPQASDMLDFSPPGIVTVDGVRGRDR